MKIRNVVDRRLKRLIEKGDGSKLDPQIVPKLIRMIAFLQDMEDESELQAFPHWKPHKLSGDRAGSWSLHVTRNWRLTFWIDNQEVEIVDLDYEDYH